MGSFAYLDKTLPQTSANVNNTYAGMSTTQNLTGTGATTVASSVKAQVAVGATYNGVLTLGTGSTLIVKGNCTLASGTNLGTNSTIAIEPGGSLTFSYSPTVNGTLTLVNRGTITCTGTLTHSNGLFYNLGTANIGVFAGAGGTFVNYNGGSLSLTNASTASTLEGRFYSYGTLTKAHANPLAYATGQETAPRSATTFEVTDHLGNVRAVVTGVRTSGAANIVNLTDYYPFGSPMRLRDVGPTVYRYGFNGKEEDSETGWEDYGFRMYNPAIARFQSFDPLAKKYPELTPYQFASNRPIDGIDLDGLEWYSTGKIYSQKTSQYYIKYTIMVKTVNSSKIVNDNFSMVKSTHGFTESKDQTIAGAEGILSNIFAFGTKEDPIVIVDIVESDNATMVVDFFDATTKINSKGEPKVDPNGNSVQGAYDGGTVNVAITRDGEKRAKDEMARTLAHELGHTAGLPHVYETPDNTEDSKQRRGPTYGQKENLLNSGENPIRSQRSTKGTKLTLGQRRIMEKTIPKRQAPKAVKRSAPKSSIKRR